MATAPCGMAREADVWDRAIATMAAKDALCRGERGPCEAVVAAQACPLIEVLQRRTVKEHATRRLLRAPHLRAARATKRRG